MSLTGVEKSKLCEAVSDLEFSAASGATGIGTAGTGPTGSSGAIPTELS